MGLVCLGGRSAPYWLYEIVSVQGGGGKVRVEHMIGTTGTDIFLTNKLRSQLIFIFLFLEI